MKKKLGQEFPSVDGVVIEVALRSVSTVKLCKYREKNHVTLAGLGCESCSFFHSYSVNVTCFFASHGCESCEPWLRVMRAMTASHVSHGCESCEPWLRVM